MGLLAPGTVFAGHRIESLVGQGGMGVVYRARQLELDRVVALKLIAPGLLEDARMRERFLREARTAASIEHPNVIPLHYAGEEDGIAYLAMRYVDGDDVRSLVRLHGVLAPDRAAEITAQAAAALDAIHAHGLVHRDVKPANLLLAPWDHVYLTDFGLAKAVRSGEAATRSGDWVGTLDYVAPEQIRGGRVDARADVYALGGVLHFMLTAHVPFDRDSDEAKLWAHLSDPPPLPSRLRAGLPPELDEVIARAMAKDPADRYPSAGDLGRAACAAARRERPVRRERMVARGAATPDGAAREPGLAEEAPTLTGTRGAPDSAPVAAAAVPARPRGRRPALALGALAALAAATAAIVVVGDEPDPSGSGAAPGGVRVAETIEQVGRRPNGIVAAGSDLWVTSYGQTRLARIDAASGRVRGERPRVGQGALDIAADGDAVWVAVTPQHSVVRVDARTGRVTRRLRTPLRPVALEAGSGGLWVVGRAAEDGGADALLHYDGDGRLARRVDVPHGISDVALGGGAVWVAELRIGRVLRVDPRTGRTMARAPLEDPGFAIAHGAGYVWVTQREDDSVARIDPRSGDVVTSAAGQQPAGIAVAGSRVFVACTTDHTVVVLDPRTAVRVGPPVPVPLNPYALATGLGGVWVASAGANSVTRLEVG